MGKRLNTTVHFVDRDTGETEVWQPGRKLSAADVKKLGWPKGHESIVDDDDPEDVSQADHLRAGHPVADRTGPADSPSDVDEESMALRQAARELETASEGHGRIQESHPVEEVVEQTAKSKTRSS